MGVGTRGGAAQLQTLTLEFSQEPSGGNSDNRESCDRGSDGRNKRWNKQQINSGATTTTKQMGKSGTQQLITASQACKQASGTTLLTPDQRFLITCLDKRFVLARFCRTHHCLLSPRMKSATLVLFTSKQLVSGSGFFVTPCT